jgi:predicted DNA-binding transcriptional regulator AlpA
MHTGPERNEELIDEYLSALDLEKWTGTKASTWRYWASIGQGPASFKLGKRRVWKRSAVMAWLADQEKAAAASA